MPFFKLKSHAGPHVMTDKDGVERTYYADGTGAGAIVESDDDLLVGDLADKFEECKPTPRQLKAMTEAKAPKAKAPAKGPTPPVAGQPRTPATPHYTHAGLEAMTIPELRALATKEDVDLPPGSPPKDKIIDAILKAQAEAHRS